MAMSNDPGLDRGPRRRFRLSELSSAQQFWVPLAIVLVLALAGGAIAAVADQDVPVPIAGEGNDDGGVVAPVEDESVPDPETVFDDPGKYVGQELSLSVVVDKVVDPNSFRVVSEDPNDPSLLVVYSGLPVVKEQMIIKAAGTIQPFTSADVNKTLGAKLPVSTFDMSDDDFALVASSVEVVIDASGGGKPGGTTDVAVAAPGTTAVAVAPPAPVYQPAPYVPPASSGTSTGTSSGSGSGTSSGGSEGSNGGSTGSSEPSGGSGGGGGGSEPSGGANGSPAAARGDLTFTEDSATFGQYSDTTYLEALLTDGDGAPVAGAKLTFVLDDAEYTARTDGDGIASTSPTLSIEPGTYQLEVLWLRAGKTRAKDKDRFEVAEDDSVLQVATEGNGNNATLTARLSDGDSETTGLASRQIDFYSEDGELLGSATTDANGVARLDVPQKYQENKDDFTATFAGDDYYLTSSATSD
jgi:hypothetical protein